MPSIDMANICRTFNITSGPHAGMAVSVVNNGDMGRAQLRLHPQGTRPKKANSVVLHSGLDEKGRYWLRYDRFGPRSRLYRVLQELGLPAAEILRAAQYRKKRQQFVQQFKFATPRGKISVRPNYKHYAQHPQDVASWEVALHTPNGDVEGQLVPCNGGFQLCTRKTADELPAYYPPPRYQPVGYHAGNDLEAAAKHVIAMARFNKAA